MMSSGLDDCAGSDLWNAIELEDVTQVKVLIDRGVNPNLEKADVTPLILACDKGSLEVVKLLVDGGAQLNSVDKSGRTALMCVAQRDAVAIVNLLLNAGADVEAKDSYDTTTLMFAASKGSYAAVKLLIDAGAAINAVNHYHRSSLMFAAELGDAAIVKILLDIGADVQAKDKSGATALMSGAASGSTDTVKLLIDAGASVNAVNKENKSALMHAAEKGLESVIKMLIESGGDVNAMDKSHTTVLMSAAASGSADTVKVLLDAGADTAAVDKVGCSALMRAAEKGSAPVVKLLVDAGADTLTKNRAGCTALAYCVASGSIDAVKLLIDAGADVNTKDKYEVTVLMRAAEKGCAEIVNLLVCNGADVKAVDKENVSCIMLASAKGHADALKILINAGGDVNFKDNKGKTPLISAASNGSHDCVKLLIDAGADVTLKDKSGSSALLKAALKGSVNVTRLLIEAGADVNAVDQNECTALIIASSEGMVNNAKFLIQSGANVHAFDKHRRNALMGAAGQGCYEIVTLLVAAGAEVNSRDENACTVLMMAVKGGSVEVVKFLMQSGVDVNTRDKEDKSALIWAINKGFDEAVKLLIGAGADVNGKDKSDTSPLGMAIRKENPGIVKILIDGGADLAVLELGHGLFHCVSRITSPAALVAISLLLLSHGLAHSVVNGVPTVAPIFSGKEFRKIKVAVCTVDFLSTCQLHWNNYDIWNQVVQVSDVEGIEEVVRALVTCRPELATVRDAMGRMAVDLATPKIKFILNSVSLWFGKYRPGNGKPEHTSATCFVFKAMDESGEEPLPVALKLMRVKAQFIREIEMRKYGFDSDYVISQSECIPSRSLLGSDPDLVEVSSSEESKGVLNKAQAERLYCVVMPLAERNMFVAMKQERFAGKEDLSEVVTIFTQLVKCVAHMHSKGVLHGDIKPMNLVRMGGKWVLIDLDACCVIGRDAVGFKSSSAYVPPEAIFADYSAGIVNVKSEFSCRQYPNCEPLIAAESFDVWSLGCILYQFCSVGVLPLFAANQDDNLNTDLNDPENSLWRLSEWNDRLKEKKLMNVANLKARNLLSLMLTKDPSKRPTLSRVLGHPFLSGDSSSGRLAGEPAEYDVFLSYRVWSDKIHAEKLYGALTAAGLRVWWDKVCLESGKEWQSGFCRGLGTSTAFVCLLSEDGTDAPFQSLQVESGCDNVLLEHRLALELKQIEYIKYVFPIMIGGSNGEYRGSRNESKNHVTSVEEAVKGYMNELGLGTPLKNNPSVFEIEKAIRQCQGFFVDDGNGDHTVEKAVEGILKALRGYSGVAPAPSRSVTSLRREVTANKPQGAVSEEEVESIRAQYESQLEIKDRSYAKDRETLLYDFTVERNNWMRERDQLLKELQELKS